MVLHQRPGAVVHTVALVDQQLAHVSGRHVGWNLHDFTGPILAPHLHYLKAHVGGDGDLYTTAAKVVLSKAETNKTKKI